MRLLRGMRTQWVSKVFPNGRIVYEGLHYPSLAAVERGLGVSCAAEQFEQLQLLEAFALDLMNGE